MSVFVPLQKTNIPGTTFCCRICSQRWSKPTEWTFMSRVSTAVSCTGGLYRSGRTQQRPWRRQTDAVRRNAEPPICEHLVISNPKWLLYQNHVMWLLVEWTTIFIGWLTPEPCHVTTCGKNDNFHWLTDTWTMSCDYLWNERQFSLVDWHLNHVMWLLVEWTTISIGWLTPV